MSVFVSPMSSWLGLTFQFLHLQSWSAPRWHWIEYPDFLNSGFTSPDQVVSNSCRSWAKSTRQGPQGKASPRSFEFLAGDRVHNKFPSFPFVQSPARQGLAPHLFLWFFTGEDKHYEDSHQDHQIDRHVFIQEHISLPYIIANNLPSQNSPL